jgi:hypothetical protein
LLLLLACAGLWALTLFVRTPSSSHGDPHAVRFASTLPGAREASERSPSAGPRTPRALTATAARPLPAEKMPANLAAVSERWAKLRAEQERRNQYRFDLAEQQWASDAQQRDAAWAGPRERVLRGAIERDGAGPRLRSVQCGRELCRIELTAPASENEPALGRAENFTREVGIQTATAIRVEGTDRVLTLFVTRHGERLDAPSPPHAEDLPAPKAARARPPKPEQPATP